jgi:hypothetical protein
MVKRSPNGGSKGWVLRLGTNARSQGLVPRFGKCFWSYVWVPRLISNVRFQGQVPWLGFTVGWVPALVPRVWYQCWVARLGSKVR